MPRRCFSGLPAGLFSLFEAVQRGEVHGRVYFMEQAVPAFGEDSLVKRSGLGQDGFQPWPVFSAQLRNARLFGRNLILLNDRKQACRESMFAGHCPATDESYQVPTFDKPALLPGRWTSLVSRWDSGYWHFLMDALPRLHALPDFPADTGILVRGPIAAWQWEILQLLGVADRVRATEEKHLVIEELYFSSHTSMTGACNPFAVHWLRERLLPAVQRLQHGNGKALKIFIKRGPDWTRGIRNQVEVIRFFEERGWMILEPEKLDIKEQIELFSRVDAVCAVHGSALTNLLWMRPGGVVLELVSDNFMLGAFEWLARIVHLEHRHLLFPGDHRLSFEVDTAALGQVIDAM